MSRQIKMTARRFAAAFLLLLLAAVSSFAANANIVSPAENSILYADSLLVSVKLSDSKTVRITVYKEQTLEEQETVQKDGSTVKEIVAVDADASFLTAEDLALIVQGNKTTEDGELVLLSDGNPLQEYTDSVFAETVEYTNTANGIGFYTKKLTDVQPGLYKVVVETPAADKAPAEIIFSYTAVKEQQEEKEGIFSAGQQSNALLFLQTLLKNLFR